jgi:hypothetical protein
VSDFNEKGEGLALLTDLFQASDDKAIWVVLADRLKENKKHHISQLTEYLLSPFKAMQTRWEKPTNDNSWTVKFDENEARAHSLLRILSQSGWVVPEDEMNPIADSHLQKIIADWLERHLQNTPKLLWLREEIDKAKLLPSTSETVDEVENEVEKVQLPIPTSTAVELDILLPQQGLLWETVLAELPIDAWLLQGEAVDEEGILWWEFSQACVLLTLYPKETLPEHIQLALQLYQALIVVETAAAGSRILANFFWSLSLSLSLSRSLSRSRALSRSRLLSLSRSLSLSLLRSLSRSRSRSLREALEKIANYLDKHEPENAILEPFSLKLEFFGYRYAGFDWFKEQIEEPDLMRRRGLQPNQPLPAALGLFDEQGLPLATQQRRHWLKLQDWLEKDDDILDFTFQDKSPTNRKSLKEQLTQLRQQPWSPQAGVAAILADWPEEQETRICTIEAAEAELFVACQAFLEAVGSA